MIQTLALAVVALTGLYLLLLGAAALLAPARAGRFLLGFVGSPAAHFLEMFLRLLVGAAFLLSAPRLLFADAFTVFGWVLLITSAALLLVPWRWHQRIARQSVPRALRFLPLIGVASVAIGGFILVSVIRGRVA